MQWLAQSPLSSKPSSVKAFKCGVDISPPHVWVLPKNTCRSVCVFAGWADVFIQIDKEQRENTEPLKYNSIRQSEANVNVHSEC